MNKSFDIEKKLNNIWVSSNLKKINSLLGREDNSQGYPLPGKEGISYKDASPEIKEEIYKILKLDQDEWEKDMR